MCRLPLLTKCSPLLHVSPCGHQGWIRSSSSYPVALIRSRSWLRDQVQRLMDLIVPELRPQNIEAVIDFVREKRAVVSLRQEFFSLFRSGEEVSVEWYQRYINEVLRSELADKNRGRRIRWLGAVAGALAPGSGIVSELAADMAIAGIEKGLGDRDISCRWLYALLERE